MQTVEGVDAIAARKALLCEFWNNNGMRQYCNATAARASPSPFLKKFLEKPGQEIIQAWKTGAVERACPDFAFGDPFPHKIVFEGKYFENGNAEVALVTLIREAFFYRAFPYASPSATKTHWDYDFSCAMAYDASETGALRNVWDSLPANVREGFWGGSNLYVIILRPSD